MPGTGGIDITITTSGLLPNVPENIISEMNKLGFDFCGPSPHCMNKNLDQWFMFNDSKNKDAQVKLAAVHVVPIENAEESVQKFLDYV